MTTGKFFRVGFFRLFGAQLRLGSDYFLVRLAPQYGPVEAVRRRTRQQYYVVDDVIGSGTFFFL